MRRELLGGFGPRVREWIPVIFSIKPVNLQFSGSQSPTSTSAPLSRSGALPLYKATPQEEARMGSPRLQDTLLLYDHVARLLYLLYYCFVHKVGRKQKPETPQAAVSGMIFCYVGVSKPNGSLPCSA